MLQHLTFRILEILQKKNEFFYNYDKGHSFLDLLTLGSDDAKWIWSIFQ